ncbi:pyridoxal phosphate-dependent aminotransferase [Saccharospirillum salsuginis]|nr:pyridoxal phosphate-dependent aminotransferase [Saccharospirillum salsuginis]
MNKEIYKDTGSGLFPDDQIVIDSTGYAVADYSDESGLFGLRESYVYSQHNNCLSPDNVLVTSGVKESLLLIALYSQGKRNLIGIPEIAWPGYAKVFGGLGYELTFYKHDCITSITEATKSCSMVVLNNPHNPTGVTLNKHDIETISEKARSNNCLLVIDECLLHYSLGSSERTFLDNDNTHTLVVDSISKWGGMPGLRVGFINAHTTLIRDLVNVKSDFINPVSSIAQIVASRNMSKMSNWALKEKETSQSIINLMGRLVEKEDYEVIGTLTQYMWIKSNKAKADDFLTFNGHTFEIINGQHFGANKRYARFNYRQCARVLNGH